MVTSGQISVLLEPGIRTLTGKGLRLRDPEHSQFLSVATSQKAKETNLELAGLPIAVERGENDPIATFDPIVGSTKAHTMRSFAIGLEMSWESVDDEQYGWLPTLSRQLGSSMREAREIHAARVINKGFLTGGDVKGYDGLTLFSLVHPALGQGATQANVFAGDISFGALQTVITDFENRTDHQGLKMRVRPTKLFYAPANDFLVQEILRSEKKPGGNLNDVNTLQGRLQPVMLHYLDAADIWFVKGDLGEEFDLRFYDRTPPSMMSFDDPRTRSSVFTLASRYVAGADAWQNVYGGKTTP